MKTSVYIIYGFVLQRIKTQPVCVNIAAAILDGAVCLELETSGATPMSLRRRYLLRVTGEFTLHDLRTRSSWLPQGSGVNGHGGWWAGNGKGCVSGRLSGRKNCTLVHVLG